MTRRDAGFSLIEMLVSLVVLGLAAVLLTIGIERIGLSFEIANRQDNSTGQIANAQFLLRQRLAGIQPLADTSGTGSLDFVGLDNRVDFIAEAADRAAPDALQYYRIARDPDGDLMLLSASTLDQRVDPHNPANLGWTAFPLLSGTAGIEIRYLAPAPGHGLVWQDRWARQTSLPALVRVRISFPQGDPRAWPDLIVHPRGTVTEKCPLGSISEECRKAQAGDS